MSPRFRRQSPWLSACLLACLLAWPPKSTTAAAADGQERVQRTPAPSPTKPDLTREPTLYVVGYAHLDTQWRWDYVTTIREYLVQTMRLNFDLFEKYPHYVFNFSGANRYRLMKEYYPADYEKVKKYVAAGRWYPSGSSMEENDVNATSAESIIRQVLYGTQYFRREFGKSSAEFMLPDCFGFPASLPSILAHCGIKGFSTQKLVWGSLALVGGPHSPEKTPAGTPFNVGLWEGPDGRSVIAALNPGSYDGSITYDLSKAPPAAEGEARRGELTDWPARVQLNGQVSGLFTDYMYYGTGDIGGAPEEASVKLLDAIVTKKQRGDGPLKIVSAASDRMFLDIEPGQTARLPRYKGDLELTNHSAGSITSQAYMKRWNRLNEVLADGAEKASLAAEWLAGRSYPRRRLNDAWTLVMGGQFHDILPGTSIPKAYEYSWNDEALAMNQFAGVLESAADSVASALDTRGQGIALVVYNPLNIEREDIVEAEVSFPGGGPKAVRVFGPDGREVPAQLAPGKVIFPAKMPSVGFAVYDVEPVEPAASSGAGSPLKVTESTLENDYYRLTLDRNGDLAGIFDKALSKELLYAPARLEIKTDNPARWPAWNMDWEDQSRSPRAFVKGPARFRIVESGPARVALEVSRETEGSRFVQTIRLAAGEAGRRIEFRNVIDWMTKEAHLKAVFPLTASNPKATYNWDIGTIERSTDEPRKFEVPSHQWFDLTDESGAYGVTILSDCKYGSDKPDDNTLRLTLVRTPGTRGGYTDQGTQDWGRHDFIYGLAGHAGDFRQGQTDWQGFRLNQPLLAFQSPSHAGALGKSFSFMNINHSRIRVLALKKAEESDEIIVRLVEMDGRPARGVRLRFAAPVLSAREVNGVEMPVGEASVMGGELAADFGPFQVRTFALKLGPAPAQAAAAAVVPVALPYDQIVASRDKTRVKGGFDSSGRSLPSEMLPAEMAYAGVRFRLAPSGRPDAVVARGQTISLPAGPFNRLYILAASAEGDQKACFRIGRDSVELTIQDWSGYIGQWDNRLWNTREEPVPRRPGEPAQPPGGAPRMRTVMDYAGLKPGYVKPAAVAWFASHRHGAAGDNEPYAYSYLFAYAVDVPAGATTLTLPDNDKIRVLAVTAAHEVPSLRPAQSLVDAPER
ncbi:MAG: glycoside hydrolase family 38 C-terminal domain-containing protein [Candidatus Aminicenantales bacterium]